MMKVIEESFNFPQCIIEIEGHSDGTRQIMCMEPGMYTVLARADFNISHLIQHQSNLVRIGTFFVERTNSTAQSRIVRMPE